MTLTVPHLDLGVATLRAALDYAQAGWFVGPIDQHHKDPKQRKNPGAVLGAGWQHKTSRDPHVIASWFAGTRHGVFLHAGRSGAVIFDVDRPEAIPEPLKLAIDTVAPPMQTTRSGDTRRGHYLYAQPDGRTIGNGTGRLGAAWGEVRGLNGMIVVAPSTHAEESAGGLYAWQHVGDVPTLPAFLADHLDDATPTADTVATTAQAQAFLADHDRSERPPLFTAVVDKLEKAIADGGSRHDALVTYTCMAMREARDGLYPAKQAAERLKEIFVHAIGGDRNPRDEFDSILRWAISQALTTDVDEHRSAVDQRAPDRNVQLTISGSPETRDEVVAQPSSEHLLTAAVRAAEPHRGQVRIARRLESAYANRLMHVHGLGWHAWDTKRWVPATRGQAKQAVLEVLREALSSALGDSALQTDVRKCESASGVNGVLDIASALPAFAVEVSDIDRDPYLLNVANGTLDLRTSQLRPHDPADRITKIAAGAYRPDQTSTAWPSFLARVLPDAEVRAFLQRLAGVGLLGVVVEHVLGILTGTGRNGKGVFYGALGHALGDYAIVAEPDLFMHREGAHPTGQMDLRGVRWVAVSENDKGRRLAEATMKKLTGGDEIKARHMRQDFVSFSPSHTPLLVTNHLPKVSGDDPALWARMRVIPFNVVIPKAEQDPHLPERLQLEADAILSWAIAGYEDWRDRGGLAEPDAVKVATNDYQRDNDAVRRFVDEACTVGPAFASTMAGLFDRWATWQRDDGADALSKRAFGDALDRLGYTTTRGTGGVRHRQGIAPATIIDDDTEGSS